MEGVIVDTPKPPNEAFDETDLRRWPWAICDVELVDGLAFVHARHRGGFTVDDVDAIPDDGRRYELLDGVIVVSPSPGYQHQRAAFNLGAVLRAAERGTAVGLAAPYDVPLALARRFQPDLLVLPTPEATAPLLCVEVLSPSGRRYDRVIKREVYEAAGIPAYWLVDPAAPSVEVLELDDTGRYQTVALVTGEDDCVVTRPFPVSFSPASLLR